MQKANKFLKGKRCERQEAILNGAIVVLIIILEKKKPLGSFISKPAM